MASPSICASRRCRRAGEKVVIRILDSRATVKSLDSSASIRVKPKRSSGCSKTTKDLARHRTDRLGEDDDALLGDQSDQGEGVNIVTVEDPLIPMQGCPVQVQEKAGLTFAARCAHSAAGPQLVLIARL